MNRIVSFASSFQDPDAENEPEEVDAVEEDPDEEDETGAVGAVTLDEEEEEK